MTLEQAKLGLKIERENVRKACQTIARLTMKNQQLREALRSHLFDPNPSAERALRALDANIIPRKPDAE